MENSKWNSVSCYNNNKNISPRHHNPSQIPVVQRMVRLQQRPDTTIKRPQEIVSILPLQQCSCRNTHRFKKKRLILPEGPTVQQKSSVLKKKHACSSVEKASPSTDLYLGLFIMMKELFLETADQFADSKKFIKDIDVKLSYVQFERRIKEKEIKIRDLQQLYIHQNHMRNGADKLIGSLLCHHLEHTDKKKKNTLKGHIVECRNQQQLVSKRLIHIEKELNSMAGSLKFKVLGLMSFSRVCTGDTYEYTFKLGNQKWKSKCKVEALGQKWIEPEFIFQAIPSQTFSIKMTELVKMGKTNTIGTVECSVQEFMTNTPQVFLLPINSIGTIKLRIGVAWSPLDGSDHSLIMSNINSSNSAPIDFSTAPVNNLTPHGGNPPSRGQNQRKAGSQQPLTPSYNQHISSPVRRASDPPMESRFNNSNDNSSNNNNNNKFNGEKHYSSIQQILQQQQQQQQQKQQQHSGSNSENNPNKPLSGQHSNSLEKNHANNARPLSIYEDASTLNNRDNHRAPPPQSQFSSPQYHTNSPKSPRREQPTMFAPARDMPNEFQHHTSENLYSRVQLDGQQPFFVPQQQSAASHYSVQVNPSNSSSTDFYAKTEQTRYTGGLPNAGISMPFQDQAYRPTPPPQKAAYTDQPYPPSQMQADNNHMEDLYAKVDKSKKILYSPSQPQDQLDNVPVNNVKMVTAVPIRANTALSMEQQQYQKPGQSLDLSASWNGAPKAATNTTTVAQMIAKQEDLSSSWPLNPNKSNNNNKSQWTTSVTTKNDSNDYGLNKITSKPTQTVQSANSTNTKQPPPAILRKPSRKRSNLGPIVESEMRDEKSSTPKIIHVCQKILEKIKLKPGLSEHVRNLDIQILKLTEALKNLKDRQERRSSLTDSIVSALDSFDFLSSVPEQPRKPRLDASCHILPKQWKCVHRTLFHHLCIIYDAITEFQAKQGPMDYREKCTLIVIHNNMKCVHELERLMSKPDDIDLRGVCERYLNSDTLANTWEVTVNENQPLFCDFNAMQTTLLALYQHVKTVGQEEQICQVSDSEVCKSAINHLISDDFCVTDRNVLSVFQFLNFFKKTVRSHNVAVFLKDVKSELIALKGLEAKDDLVVKSTLQQFWAIPVVPTCVHKIFRIISNGKLSTRRHASNVIAKLSDSPEHILTDIIMESLENEDPNIKAGACIAVGELQMKSIASRLQYLHQVGNPTVKAAARTSLNRLGQNVG